MNYPQNKPSLPFNLNNSRIFHPIRLMEHPDKIGMPIRVNLAKYLIEYHLYILKLRRTTKIYK